MSFVINWIIYACIEWKWSVNFNWVIKSSKNINLIWHRLQHRYNDNSITSLLTHSSAQIYCNAVLNLISNWVWSAMRLTYNLLTMALQNIFFLFRSLSHCALVATVPLLSPQSTFNSLIIFLATFTTTTTTATAGDVWRSRDWLLSSIAYHLNDTECCYCCHSLSLCCVLFSLQISLNRAR